MTRARRLPLFLAGAWDDVIRERRPDWPDEFHDIVFVPASGPSWLVDPTCLKNNVRNLSSIELTGGLLTVKWRTDPYFSWGSCGPSAIDAQEPAPPVPPVKEDTATVCEIEGIEVEVEGTFVESRLTDLTGSKRSLNVGSENSEQRLWERLEVVLRQTFPERGWSKRRSFNTRDHPVSSFRASVDQRRQQRLGSDSQPSACGNGEETVQHDLALSREGRSFGRRGWRTRRGLPPTPHLHERLHGRQHGFRRTRRTGFLLRRQG